MQSETPGKNCVGWYKRERSLHILFHSTIKSVAFKSTAGSYSWWLSKIFILQYDGKRLQDNLSNF